MIGNRMEKFEILGKTLKEAADFFKAQGFPEYRAKQVYRWIFQKACTDFNLMTDLPLALRSQLEEMITAEVPAVIKSQFSSSDRTEKLLLRLSDGYAVEAVRMEYRLDRARDRVTFCLSSQIGCPIGCPFCATGQTGFVRNLTAAEIVGQALALLQRGEADVEGINVVFMGMGEPFLNLEAVKQAVYVLHEPQGMGISWRRFTVSTAGVVPGIYRLAEEKLPVNLAVSLHAADNKLRDRLVPVNRRYPLEELLPACAHYARATGRRVSFEYVLIHGVNDSVVHASKLADLLAGMQVLVNLIPANPTERSNFKASSAEALQMFKRVLSSRGIGVTVRESKGSAISAACGQLRYQVMGAKGKGGGA